MRRRNRAAAGLAAALLATALVTVPGTGAASAATVATNATRAAAYAKQQHMASGIAVLDTRTGALYTAGRSTRLFPSASVVKTLIATRLLLAGRMTGHNATLARAMITRSDNAAAWALYPKVGRDGLLPWIARHYRLRGLGTRPTMPGIWGSTQLTARGLARFYAAVRKDPRVWPWLSRAMHAYRQLSSAGEPNAFGIAAVAPSAAVKNGWDVDRDVHAPTNAIINTTGFVQRDRYAVVILAEGPGSLYFARGERIVTRAAALLMPGGRITPIPPPRIAAVTPDSGRTAGGTRVTVTGSGFTHVRAVRFGSLSGRSVDVLSATRLRATVPAHPAGRVSVRVRTEYGTSAGAPFTYVAAPRIFGLAPGTGALAGGTRVSVAGANFRHVRSVRFGGVAGTSIAVLSATRLQVTAPAHAPGSVGVVVVTGYGTSSAARFGYLAAPTVAAVTPNTGSALGGEETTITGTGFGPGTSVGFGAGPAATVRVDSATGLTVTTPPGVAGVVDVRVTTAYGTSAIVGADEYTYA